MLLCALLPVAASAAQATDTSFRLSVGLDQLPAYFPGVLGNGYIATPTVPRGTEAAQTYLVGLMDYSPGDISRPALVPGWTEMDFAPGASGSNREWVNEAPLVAAHFADRPSTCTRRLCWRLFETGGTLKPPYEGCTETASNEVGPFLTGSGSYLQSLIYGLTGLRIRQAGIVAAYPPALPTGWGSLTLRNIIFRGRRITIRVTRDRSGVVRLSGLK